MALLLTVLISKCQSMTIGQWVVGPGTDPSLNPLVSAMVPKSPLGPKCVWTISSRSLSFLPSPSQVMENLHLSLIGPSLAV